MKSRFRYEILLVFVVTARTSVGVEKYWLPDLEWQTAKNWMDDRLPEIDSRVVFPLETRHAVGMSRSGDLRLSGIDLARSGSLVLTRDGRLELSESTKSPRKMSQWLKEGHFFWADPGNWNGSIAAPHLEQVPCRQDGIVLPNRTRTISMLLPMKKIQVTSVRTADQKYPFTPWQWTDLENQREFAKGLLTVSYVDYVCETCPCQDDPNGDYFEEICAIQRPKCGYAPCEYPLTVEGHCCRYCGGRVSLPSKASLSVVRMAANEALEGYAERIAWHVRRTWQGASEILIKEKTEYSGIDVLKAVEDLKTVLLSFGIEVESTETGGAAVQDNRLAVALVPLFGTPLIVLLLLFIGSAYFGYSFRYVLSSCSDIFSSIRDGILVDKSEESKPFGFARFENIPEGNVQIANAPRGEQKMEAEEQGNKDSTSGGRFENPLYRSKRRRNEEKMLDMQAPLSLAALRDKAEDQIEEMEVDIDQ